MTPSNDKLKVAFDLDGTLDIDILRRLALFLAEHGAEIHVITGTFGESGEWQTEAAKRDKLNRLGLSGFATIHVLSAVAPEFGTEYRLRDLGLRKGALCEKLGINLLFDDSPNFCDVAKRMHGGLTVLQVR